MIRRLYADIGNSRVKLADCSTPDPRVIATWGTTASPELPDDLDELVLVSVVPSALSRIVQTLSTQRRTVALRCLGVDFHAPLRLDYATPETLGMDRVAAAYAAWKHDSGGALVLGAGTALTLDWVDASGTFRGGLIAPGRAALRSALEAAAPLLPAAGSATVFPARSSAECVALGLDVAFAGMVQEAVKRARSVCGSDLPLWICGGDAALVARCISGRVDVDESLVLRGLALCNAANA
ncbi:MAG: type III pantothenate kinase [Planctomycetes bacterium]|nr:type III pantothenate kinase [Planctomycetota bacterium]